MSLAAMLGALARSLVLTLLFEGALALATGRRTRRDMMVVAAVNVATNPPLVLMYYLLRGMWRGSWLPVLVLECAAVLVEYLLYKGYRGSFKRPLLFAAAANLFSFGLGVLLSRLA